jgi:hypothetical protein
MNVQSEHGWHESPSSTTPSLSSSQLLQASAARHTFEGTWQFELQVPVPAEVQEVTHDPVPAHPLHPPQAPLVQVWLPPVAQLFGLHDCTRVLLCVELGALSV